MRDWSDEADEFFNSQEAESEKLVHCDECGEPIYDDFYWNIDGDCLCEECMNDRYRVRNDID